MSEVDKRFVWICDEAYCRFERPCCPEEKRESQGCTLAVVVDPASLEALERDAHLGRSVREWVAELARRLTSAAGGEEA